MVKFIPKKFTEPIWYPIDLGGGDSLEIAIARPTLEEQIQAAGKVAGLSYRAYELASSIKDWRGVTDEAGQPIPYSWEALNQLCAGYPDSLWEFLITISKSQKATSQPDEDSEKNLPLPPLNGGATSGDETDPTTISSNSTVDSSADATSSGSVETSD